MNNIKCIILDIDFTLTKSDGTVSNYTKEIIKKAIDKNIYVIICSGRPNTYAIEKSKMSNASPIVISDNGAIIYNYETNEILYDNNIKEEYLEKIWNISLEKNIDCVLNSLKTRYRHTNFKDSDYIKINSYINKISDLEEPISQIVISSKNKKEIINFKKEIEKIDELEVTNTNLTGKMATEYYFCDINKKGNSKGKAIIKLLEMLNIKNEDTICFGDSMNDLSMFEACINSVAMGNAEKELKQIATYITDKTSEEDGVAHFIDKNIL